MRHPKFVLASHEDRQERRTAHDEMRRQEIIKNDGYEPGKMAARLANLEPGIRLRRSPIWHAYVELAIFLALAVGFPSAIIWRMID